jgi:pilus assembly protein CpaF
MRSLLGRHFSSSNQGAQSPDTGIPGAPNWGLQEPPPAPHRPAAAFSPAPERTAPWGWPPTAGFDPSAPLILTSADLDMLAGQVRTDVVSSLGAELSESRLNDDDLRRRTADAIGTAIGMRAPSLSGAQRNQLMAELVDDLLGLGPLEHVMRDTSISEVMVNGASSVYLERDGVLHPSDLKFRDEQHLRRTIDRIVARVGRRVDESSPMVDARLPDGARVNAVIPPAAVDGSTLTIRRFRNDSMDLPDLISQGTLTAAAGTFLAACVRGRLNLLIAGATGAGKTTTLNALTAFIPAGERIITIEDAAELQVQHDHLVRLESRPPAVSGKGEITIRDLLRNALRMRPDRIIIGEVRDAAALDMLQAMSTGHSGSLGTVHASSARDALRRVETMVLLSGLEVPLRAIREQMSAGIDVIVFLSRDAHGKRRVDEIVEVAGLEGDVVTLQPLFTRGSDDELHSTGFEPGFWPAIAPHLDLVQVG